MPGYYDGGTLLSQVDINGDTPEIFMCTTNNSAGKTTWFNRFMVKKFKEGKGKFVLLYRFNYELEGIEDAFFKDIKDLFFKEDIFTVKIKDKMYAELFLNNSSCGYGLPLNLADQIKRKSHLFNDAERMLFDEFQSETNHYCSDEVNKFIAVHKAVARGKGKQSRYVPVYMVANPVTILNPYYAEMGISARINNHVHFLKGEGWVLEQGYNEAASKALSESAFNRAFAGSKYMAYSTQAIYLNDNEAFIEKPEGRSIYVMTIKYNGKEYAVRVFQDLGLMYCDDKADSSYPVKIAFSQNDHNADSIVLSRSANILCTMRKYFDQGLVRFKNQICKEVFINLIAKRQFY